MKCVICGCEMRKVESLKKTNTPNIMKEYVKDVEQVAVSFYRCEFCGHGMIDDILSTDFYEEFTVAIDDNNQENRKNERTSGVDRIVNRLLEINNGEKESILEIGSGRGFLLNRAMDFFDYGLGVEPSRVEAEAAKALGLNILVDYFEPRLKIDRKFSSFVSTMVFEHLPNPKEAVVYAYELLKDGGSGLIQVPNAQRSYINKVYFDVYPQHLHYYTPLSLTKLLHDAGFEIVSVCETSYKNYIEAYVKKPIHVDSFKNKMVKDEQFFQSNLNGLKEIGLWGGSYAARSCIYLLNRYRIRHIFDISSSKIGGYINDCNICIEYPHKDVVCSCDCIVVLANEYTKEIVNTLHDYRYTGKIIVFDDECNLKIEGAD